MKQLQDLEKRVHDTQRNVLVPVAKTTGYQMSAHFLRAPHRPSVLFLGNHSSGKSSFVNYLIGHELQKTGLAPTDDGFTIITHGKQLEEADGHTTANGHELGGEAMNELGEAFLSRLRMKTHPNPLLQSVDLVDSPGMIDAAATGNTRGYDFRAAVRLFVERADLVLFFFDPDKPGTTGETLNVFTDILSKANHKVMILMHKVDQFQNVRDFARTYGTLCWNLAKIISTKDMPHIFNTSLPSEQSDQGQTLPVKDFDVSRQEVIAQIERAPTRRMDNLVTDLRQDATRLMIHQRVVREAGRRWRQLWAKSGLYFLALWAVAFLAAWLSWRGELANVDVIIGLATILLTGLGVWVVRELFLRFRKKLAADEGLDDLFHTAFMDELSQRDRADLSEGWTLVRPETRRCLKNQKARNFLTGFKSRHNLRKLQDVINNVVPSLRRKLEPAKEEEAKAQAEAKAEAKA